MKHELTVKSAGSYRKKSTQRMVFRYTVHGSKKALDAYEDVQGDYYIFDEDREQPLYFSARAILPGCKLVVNEDTEKVYVDDSELQANASIVAQLGGNLGEAYAKAMAEQALGTSHAVKQTAPQAEEPVDEESTS